ncbi:hypothetical protein [Sphingomonas sp. PAMC 26605]|uniref:hypothetical protein n=1 Tax=Sphingomonas sp. PAMC 26605 TaxID=1112214 RepID=UPI0012F4BC79|nr:hypothetical protein [Sphingomonas sp. PAMC 26605]
MRHRVGLLAGRKRIAAASAPALARFCADGERRIAAIGVPTLIDGHTVSMLQQSADLRV